MIIYEEKELRDAVFTLISEPGDATRYEVLIIPLLGPVTFGGPMGTVEDKGFLISYLNNRRIHLFPDTKLSWSYIAESLEIRNAQSVYHVSRILNEFTKRRDGFTLEILGLEQLEKSVPNLKIPPKEEEGKEKDESDEKGEDKE